MKGILKEEYQVQGMRRSVEAVLVVHEYSHPHILLLQLGVSFYKLPGGELKPGESEEDGIRRLITESLCAENSKRVDWEVVSTLCSWWRPNFDNCLYPYICSHITKPKEQKKVLLIQVPEVYTFVVPRNCKLIAVPLFMLYGNSQTYGPIISSLPVILSQYNFIFHASFAPAEITSQKICLNSEEKSIFLNISYINAIDAIAMFRG
ncbi:cleavage and polyadenylation specificity factor subunit 5-like [Zophobas morio]|uniref:cleavage and polyadenylation specificity factor subunit 5-like n=1 Tax=Zophobas morio TaxID=2755281 RepID=UPI003083617B